MTIEQLEEAVRRAKERLAFCNHVGARGSLERACVESLNAARRALEQARRDGGPC